jgi:hypothetical protein
MTSRDGFPRLDLSNIYRASLESPDPRSSLRTVFVEASNETDARMMVAGIAAILEHRSPAETENRVYNVKSARQFIDEGSSADPERRIFEIAHSDLVFARQPMFLLREPAALTRKWAQIQSPGRPCGVWP